jgi:nitrogen regulatory protein PII
MENSVLISIVVEPTIEDMVVDWLLEQTEVSGFTSLAVDGHGSSTHSMSTAEQVAGRKKQVMFQFYLPEQRMSAVVQGLTNDFHSTGLHYWVTPIVDHGRLE